MRAQHIKLQVTLQPGNATKQEVILLYAMYIIILTRKSIGDNADEQRVSHI